MKINIEKSQARWWVILGIVTVIYHVIAFALPFPKTAVFFISYFFTLIAIAAQIYVIRTAFFKGEGIKSKFYGFPIAKLGALYLAVQLILGLLFMALGAVIPVWLPLVLCVLLFGASVIGFIAADAVREEVERQDVVLKKNVSLMRKFQSHTAMLARENQMPELANDLRKLAEEFRFSDPVSSEATAELEKQLSEDLAKLQDAVALLEKEDALKLCRKTAMDLAERNQICKQHKAK